MIWCFDVWYLCPVSSLNDETWYFYILLLLMFWYLISLSRFLPERWNLMSNNRKHLSLPAPIFFRSTDFRASNPFEGFSFLSVQLTSTFLFMPHLSIFYHFWCKNNSHKSSKTLENPLSCLKKCLARFVARQGEGKIRYFYFFKIITIMEVLGVHK